MEKRFLFAPIEKVDGGKKIKYRAILTDTSVDREGEIVGKKFMERAIEEDWLPAHSDHTFSVDNLVAKWVNKTLRKVNGHHALIAEAQFFSTEKAKNVELLLNEGAKMGVSIAALPSTEPIDKTIDGETYKEWPDGEIVSADFVTIPANKHAHAMRIAKSFSEGGDIMRSKKISKGYDKDGAHAHTDNEPLGLHNHVEIEKRIQSEVDWLSGRISALRDEIVVVDESKFASLKSFSFEKDKTEEEKQMNKEQEELLKTVSDDVKFLKEEAKKEPLPPAPGEPAEPAPEPAKPAEPEPEPAKEPEAATEPEPEPEKSAEEPAKEEKKSLSREAELRALDKNIPIADQPGVDKDFEPTATDFIKVQKNKR